MSIFPSWLSSYASIKHCFSSTNMASDIVCKKEKQSSIFKMNYKFVEFKLKIVVSIDLGVGK